uniref:SFRICE_023615 n=1 Tax=Spodoptera frugiperda TaxID=7108 RepID=A0A2H1W274_SPOFR
MSDSDVHYSRIPIPNTTAFKPPLVSVVVEYLVLAMTLTAFIYGVISWCLIEKFRHFRNFVYINAVVSSLLRLLTVSIIIPCVMQVIVIDDKDILDICRYICTYFSAVQNYWMLVICYIFYVDIVKVFRGHVKRKYLKCCLFAWGIPFLTFLTYYVFLYVNRKAKFYASRSTLDYFADSVEVFIIVSPLMINCGLYAAVLIALCHCFKPKAPTATENWRRFYIATLLFLLSDVIVLSSFIWDVMSVTFVLRAVMSKLQQFAIALFLPLAPCERLRNFRKAEKKGQLYFT